VLQAGLTLLHSDENNGPIHGPWPLSNRSKILNLFDVEQFPVAG
jgi:hypothetical protein